MVVAAYRGERRGDTKCRAVDGAPSLALRVSEEGEMNDANGQLLGGSIKKG